MFLNAQKSNELGAQKIIKKTYVCVTSITKAAKVRNISLRLVRRRGRTTTTRSRLGDRRRRGLRRGNAGVHGRRHTQPGLRLAGQNSRIAHGRSLLVGKTKLQAVGTTGRAPVGEAPRSTGGGDGHGGFARVVALLLLLLLLGSGSAIDDSDAGRGGRGGICLLLHGFAAHRRC